MENGLKSKGTGGLDQDGDSGENLRNSEKCGGRLEKCQCQDGPARGDRWYPCKEVESSGEESRKRQDAWTQEGIHHFRETVRAQAE